MSIFFYMDSFGKTRLIILGFWKGKTHWVMRRVCIQLHWSDWV